MNECSVHVTESHEKSQFCFRHGWLRIENLFGVQTVYFKCTMSDDMDKVFDSRDGKLACIDFECNTAIIEVGE